MGLDNGSRYDEMILIQQPFIEPHRTTLTQIFSLEYYLFFRLFSLDLSNNAIIHLLKKKVLEMAKINPNI
jgi:hypothetical protein